jgi:hypothetical protein
VITGQERRLPLSREARANTTTAHGPLMLTVLALHFVFTEHRGQCLTAQLNDFAKSCKRFPEYTLCGGSRSSGAGAAYQI